MFGIGFQELILLSLIGLIVLGPERLPRVANQIGGWLGQARRMTRVMKRQLEDEINFDKDLNIKPPNREPSTQPPPATPHDETYSAAHADGEPGTSVGDSGEGEGDEAEDSTTGPGDIEPAAGEPGTGVGVGVGVCDSGEGESDEAEDSTSEPGDIEPTAAATAESADVVMVEESVTKETS